MSVTSSRPGNETERVVRSFSTFMTEASYVTSDPSPPGIQAEVVICAVAHDTRSAVEKNLDMMLVGDDGSECDL